MLSSIYKKIRNRLPVKYQSKLSKLVLKMPWKPLYKKDNIDRLKKFPNGEKGGLILTADFEMSWAHRYSKQTNNYLNLGKQERKNVPRIIELLEYYNIPITWATVGHLFLDKCKKGDHDNMERIPYFDDHWKFIEGDWFDHDPYSDYKKDGEWYAPDLIEKIIHSSVHHEIGCHTFSHIDCSYKNCPPKVLDDELYACSEAAKKYGLTLSSIVFPGGTAGNFEILKKHDFNIYRKNIKIKLAYPFFDEHGLLITPSSGSVGDETLGWNKDYLSFRYKKYLEKAIKTNTIVHFWFHPSMNEWSLNESFPELLKIAAEYRNQGDLWIGTMGSIATHIHEQNILA
jgi:peptidoglycan/xylan/chitin deacetylase (PgdA/CDA1 family)